MGSVRFGEVLTMSIKDLEMIREEFERINDSYRRTFSTAARLDLLERVKKLMTAIKNIQEKT
jgi:hypothetical protein